MKQIIFLILIIAILLISCGQQSYTSVMPPLAKEEQPIQSGCSVEGLEEKDNIEYIKIKEGL